MSRLDVQYMFTRVTLTDGINGLHSLYVCPMGQNAVRFAKHLSVLLRVHMHEPGVTLNVQIGYRKQ